MYKARLGNRRHREQWALLALVLLAIGGGTVGAWLHWHHTAAQMTISTGLVPKSVSQAVNFPVYYPDPNKLPAGYTLNLNSFTSPVKNGVTYSVSYGNGQKLVFSLQLLPSDNDLESFKNNYIPINIPYRTHLGTALIGAYNNHGKTQSLISLPTNDGTWIIITGPFNTDQTNLKQVLNSLKR